MKDLSIVLENQPGALAEVGEVLGKAGVYSDHEHQLIMVVDDYQKGQAVAREWTRELWGENE